jgi:RNA polymerase primary sigma factor
MKENVPISAEELSNLVRRAKTGDRKAQDLVIVSCLPLINRIAKSYLKRYPKQGVELGDLIQAGRIGVSKSIRRYDENRNPSFLLCAINGIKGEILSELGQSNETIHIPKEQKVFIKLVIETQEKLKIELGREPGIDETAHSLRVKEKKVLTAIKSPQYEVLFEELISEVGSNGKGEVGISPHSPDESLFKVELSNALEDVLGDMPKNESDVLRFTFGINCTKETDRAIGIRLDISGERVRQIREKALRKLKQSKKGRLLQGYLREGDGLNQSEPVDDIFSPDLNPAEIKDRVLKELESFNKIIIEFQDKIINREKEGRYYVIGSQQFGNFFWEVIKVFCGGSLFELLKAADPSLFYSSSNYKTAIKRLLRLKYIFTPEFNDYNEISNILINFRDKYRININGLQSIFLFYLFVFVIFDINVLFARETGFFRKELSKARRHRNNLFSDFNNPKTNIGKILPQYFSQEVDKYEKTLHNLETLHSLPSHRPIKSQNILLFLVGNCIKTTTNKYHWNEIGKLFEHVFHNFDKNDQLSYDSKGLQREYKRTSKTKINRMFHDIWEKIPQLQLPWGKILDAMIVFIKDIIDDNKEGITKLTEKMQLHLPEGRNEPPNP